MTIRPLSFQTLFVGTAVVWALSGLSTDVTAATAASGPCWQTLIRDWSDGQIEGRYPVACYRSAIANAPTDLEIYSTLDDDLRTALRTRTATTPLPGPALRRTLALASPQQMAGSSSSTFARLAALLAALGGPSRLPGSESSCSAVAESISRRDCDLDHEIRGPIGWSELDPEYVPRVRNGDRRSSSATNRCRWS